MSFIRNLKKNRLNRQELLKPARQHTLMDFAGGVAGAGLTLATFGMSGGLGLPAGGQLMGAGKAALEGFTSGVTSAKEGPLEILKTIGETGVDTAGAVAKHEEAVKKAKYAESKAKAEDIIVQTKLGRLTKEEAKEQLLKLEYVKDTSVNKWVDDIVGTKKSTYSRKDVSSGEYLFSASPKPEYTGPDTVEGFDEPQYVKKVVKVKEPKVEKVDAFHDVDMALYKKADWRGNIGEVAVRVRMTRAQEEAWSKVGAALQEDIDAGTSKADIEKLLPRVLVKYDIGSHNKVLLYKLIKQL